MRIELLFDEVIAGQGYKAGVRVPVTIANADACLGLVGAAHAMLIDEARSPTIALQADYETWQKAPAPALGVASFSMPPYFYDATGTPGPMLATVQTALLGAPTLVDDAGGNVLIQDRRLFAKGPIPAGSYTVTVKIGGAQQSFALLAGGAATIPVGVKQVPGTLIPKQIYDTDGSLLTTVYREGAYPFGGSLIMQRILLGIA